MTCSLRPWRPSDAPALAALLNNRKILDNLRDGIPFPYTVHDAEVFLAEMAAADRDQLYPFAIEAGGTLLGSISAARCGNVHRHSAELGYYLGEPYWGRGYAADAVRQLCRRLWDTTDLLRLFAEPFAYNTASCRVLEKAGFQLEGTLRRHAVKNGRVLDMRLYACLRPGLADSDWEL